MNLLAIDYGTKRIGLAWMQEGLDVVLPYGQVQSHKSKVISPELIEIIDKENINKIVVGLPLGLDGKENENTKRVRLFADDLKKKTNLPIELVDERFTTAQSDRMGDDSVSKDERAAMVILQSYLEKQ